VAWRERGREEKKRIMVSAYAGQACMDLTKLDPSLVSQNRVKEREGSRKER